MSKIDMILDCSNQNLKNVPEKVLNMYNLKMLFLESNFIEYLSDDFFTCLPKLTWLDLRDNWLVSIPESIAHHAYLENLLLSDNKIEALPNELGLVPNLKVLQISGNPLSYPSHHILNNGVYDLLNYLKQQHEKLKPITEEDEERELYVVEPTSTTSGFSSASTKSREKLSVQQLLRKASQRSLHNGDSLPVITVKRLNKPNEVNETGENQQKQIKPGRKIHKMKKTCSKVSISSHYNTNKYIGVRKTRNNNERVMESELKEMWLSKLKDLLSDQEKILQQEKNLKALSSWRFEKKNEPPRKTKERVIETPYSTDPEYNRMLSRHDLTKQIDKQIDKMIKQNRKAAQKSDIQKLINDVVSKLKTLECTSSEELKSPRSVMEDAGREIKSIMELHKKISAIQANNQLT